MKQDSPSLPHLRATHPGPERAVVIHGHAHALAALGAAARAAPCRLLLLSAPGAARTLGPAWWATLMADLAPRLAARHAVGFLDCALAAGRAMEALRIGLRHLILLQDCPQHDAVCARAAALGATIATMRPDALDLAGKNADRQLAVWLQTGQLAATTSR